MKKILVSLLCAVMVVTFMPSMAFATDLQMPSDAENNQPQAGIEHEQPQAEEGGGEQQDAAGTDQDAESKQLQGNGTAESPYLVGSADDLKFIAEKVNAGEADYAKAVYKQTADINLNGPADNQWKPIGTTLNKFTGTFNGGGKKITGLYIDNADLEGAGLFGYIASPAKLEGITINGAKVSAKSNVGAIAGSAFTGSVKDCKVIGKINISGNYMVGGMFGGGYVSITDSCGDSMFIVQTKCKATYRG